MIKRFRQQYILTSWNEDCELQLIRIVFVVLAVSDKSCCLKQSMFCRGKQRLHSPRTWRSHTRDMGEGSPTARDIPKSTARSRLTGIVVTCQ